AKHPGHGQPAGVLEHLDGLEIGLIGVVVDERDLLAALEVLELRILLVGVSERQQLDPGPGLVDKVEREPLLLQQPTNEVTVGLAELHAVIANPLTPGGRAELEASSVGSEAGPEHRTDDVAY